MYKFLHDKVLKFTHGAEHYAVVAYSGCEFFELHTILIVVIGLAFVTGIGAIIYEIVE